MWKTTDRYVQQKRVKAVEAESRLKQVYIPNYNKPNPAAIAPNNPSGQFITSNRPCESCQSKFKKTFLIVYSLFGFTV